MGAPYEGGDGRQGPTQAALIAGVFKKEMIYCEIFLHREGIFCQRLLQYLHINETLAGLSVFKPSTSSPWKPEYFGLPLIMLL